MTRLLVVALLLPWVAGAALAGDPGTTADAVARAHTGEDRKALERLARSDDPDPWLVADSLLERGNGAAALAFARAAGRPDTHRMAAYVRGCLATPAPAQAYALLAASAPLMKRAAWKEVLAVLAPLEGTPQHVVSMRHAYRRGLALAALRRELDAARTFERVAAGAHRLGWLAMAGRALSRAGLSHVAAERWSDAVAVLDKLIVLERDRKRSRCRTGLPALGVRAREPRRHAAGPGEPAALACRGTARRRCRG